MMLHDFGFDSDSAKMELMPSLYSSDEANRTAFAEAGGKLLTWHGLSDPIVPHAKTVHCYGDLADRRSIVALRRPSCLPYVSRWKRIGGSV